VTADPRTILQQSLSDRYRIERELGRGGMAVVYLAHDLRHDRPVALKILHPDLAHALGPERFEREIHVAARLQHPHILTVLDSGEAAGQLWFTMPFVEGESLRTRLAREGQLQVDDALRIAREAADALDYAHRHGIVHRDVKPDNILLSDGHALVADFGIARAIAAGDDQLTATGASVGTAAYMSPEQAAGEREVDGRSDIFSLAVVLYEMLAGTTPYAAPTPQAMIARRFTEDAAPVRRHRASVPEAVEQALARALSRTAADRFPTSRAFADALNVSTVPTAPTVPTLPTVPSMPVIRRSLRRPVFIALVAGLLIGGGFLFAWSRGGNGGAGTADARAGSDATGAIRIAVIPFENLGDTADAYFADGVTDAVRGKLAGIDGFAVIARGSSEEYRGSLKSPTQIADELGVHYLLTGTVRWVKQADGTSRVQVRPELVEIGDGTAHTRWDEPFSASITDVFEVQEQIAGKVSGALDVALARLAERPTADLEAYNLFLQAEALPSSDPVNVRRAVSLYERAVARDSLFATAWAWLASGRAFLAISATTNPPSREQIRQALDRAIALAPDAPETYRARMFFTAALEKDVAGAIAIGEQAIGRHPREPNLLRVLGLNKVIIGDAAGGAALLERAVALDPRNPMTARALGQARVLEGRFEAAREPLQRALDLSPADHAAAMVLIQSWLAAGDLASARQALNAMQPPGGRPGLLAYVSMYGDYYWILDPAQQDTLMRLGVESFDGDLASRELVVAQVLLAREDTAGARRAAETARREFERVIGGNPDPQLPALVGFALAIQGRHADASRWLARSAAQITEGDTDNRAYNLELTARAAMLAGDHDAALDALERWVEIPPPTRRGRVRVHPEYAPLRGNPRFERIAR